MEDQTQNTILLEWDSPEYKEKEKKADWFWAISIIAIAGGVVSFITGNFLFGMFIILSSITLIYFRIQKPKNISYALSNEGIYIGNFLYVYDNIKSFWLEEDKHGHHKLLIHSSRQVMPVLTITFTDDKTGDNIYEILSEIIPETPLREPLSHQLLEKLGF